MLCILTMIQYCLPKGVYVFVPPHLTNAKQSCFVTCKCTSLIFVINIREVHFTVRPFKPHNKPVH